MDTKNKLTISRRNLIKGFGAGMAGVLLSNTMLPHRTASAQIGTPTVGGMSSAFYRFNLGQFEVTVINDGMVEFNISDVVANAPLDEVASVLDANNLNTEYSRFSLDQLLINTGERLVLIDTGDNLSGFVGDRTGKLLPTLELLGVAPADINDVIITHFHWDHMGGMTQNGEIAFPNAQYHFPQLEWDFLQSGNVPQGAEAFIQFSLDRLQPIEANTGQLSLYTDGQELVSGIQALHTPGHTPGHAALLIESEGAQLMYTSYIVLHYLLPLQNPDWLVRFDQLPDVAVDTRRRILSRLADEDIPMMGYHFPFPGIGYVARDGDGFRYLPSN